MSKRERQSGFNDREIKCSCGAEFNTISDLIAHARDDHGVPVTD